MLPYDASLVTTRPIASSSPYLRVLLQVDGLHCPSCVEHVSQRLRSLSLPSSVSLSDVAVSYLDHTVLFHLTLPDALSSNVVDGQETRDALSSIVAALKEEAYPPQALECKVVQSGTRSTTLDTRTVVPFELHELGDEEQGNNTRREKEPQWSLWKQIRHPRQTAKDKEAEREREARWQRHLQACKSCREGSEHTSLVDQKQSSCSSIDHTQEWTADLSVGGMTCSSCVSNVAKVAETVERVKSIQVNLMTSSARLITEDESVIQTVAEAISDAGYEVAIMTKHSSVQRKGASQMWKATYVVGGMTCASCVSNVEKAVASMTGAEEEVQSFHVALMQQSAVAIYPATDRDGAQERAHRIRESVEDAGYDCSLEEVREEMKMSSVKTDRKVRLRVDGMFCSKCVEKVLQYLQSSPHVHVEEGMTLANPTVTMTYLPSSTTTIRSILAGIDALDPAFQADIVVPPSVSSRSALYARRELQSLLIRLVCAFLFVPPTLLIAVIVPTFLSKTHPLRLSLSVQTLGQVSKADIILWALATPVQFGVGLVFYQRAFKSLRSVWRGGRSWTDRLVRWGDMNVLVALGTSVAYFASLAFLIVDATRESMEGTMEESMTYFDASVFLIFFILFGRVLEAWSKRKTTSAVSALGSLRPMTGLLLQQPESLTSSAVTTVAVELLEVNDIVLVPSGSSPPLDSTLVSSSTDDHQSVTFLESAISGEAKAVFKSEGDQLYAGTVNQSKSAILARVQALAGDSLIDNVIEIVQSSSSRKADVEQLADRVTSHFVPIIVALALIVLIIWLSVLYSPGTVSDQWKQEHIQNFTQSGSQILYALQFAVSVLVVACPCGIGLAAPTAQIIAIGLASKHGILVQGGGQAFQSAVQFANKRAPKAFVFDKTGTVTYGNEGSVSEAHVSSLPAHWTEEDLVKAIWLVEGNSGHPISVGVRGWCEAQSMKPSEVQIEGVDEVAGRGLKARILLHKSHDVLLIGSFAFMQEESSGDVSLANEMQGKVTEWQDRGASVVFVAIRSENSLDVVAVLSLADTIRPEATAIIDVLKRWFNGQVWMVSGDTVHTAKVIASQVGIAEENVVAGVLPTQKAEWVDRIKEISGNDLEGQQKQSTLNRRLVAFVGDGINDAPALSSADLSIALGSGSSLATSTASFILLNSQSPLASIPAILSLSKATNFKIWQNLAWACAFNIVFIPIAAGAFVQKGFTFGPSWSGLAMALSSVSVVLNALTLRLWRAPSVPLRPVSS